MPSLSLTNSIADIDSVKSLASGHPVYLLTAIDKSRVVVKRENKANAQASLGANLNAMRAATGQTTGTVLKNGEVLVLQDFVQEWTDLVAQTAIMEPLAVGQLRNDLAMPGTWYKMPKAAGINDLDAAITSLMVNQDKVGVRSIAKALSATDGLETLGRVIAADFYNGNDDRFAIDGDGGSQNQRTAARFRVLFNIKNVLVMVDHGVLRPAGLDSFDSSSRYGDVDQTIPALEARTGSLWPGHKLASVQSGWRKQYCKDVIADLEDSWGPRNRKIIFASKARLPWNADTRLYKGMSQGIDGIIAHVRFVGKRANAPAGLASRLQILTS